MKITQAELELAGKAYLDGTATPKQHDTVSMTGIHAALTAFLVERERRVRRRTARARRVNPRCRCEKTFDEDRVEGCPRHDPQLARRKR